MVEAIRALRELAHVILDSRQTKKKSRDSISKTGGEILVHYPEGGIDKNNEYVIPGSARYIQGPMAVHQTTNDAETHKSRMIRALRYPIDSDRIDYLLRDQFYGK